jgi:hypothetical protein
MATKKNRKKKQTKAKKVVRRKAAPKKQLTKKAPLKKAAPKKAKRKKQSVPGKSQRVATVAFRPEGLRPRSGGQSGNLQGLSSRPGADSESVDELLEEGNAFEAEAVEGVEDAADPDEGEVVTHEVPEDDVPGEYLDKDK